MRVFSVAFAALLIGSHGFCGVGSAQSQTVTTVSADQPRVRERINIDKDWRFAYGHATDNAKDFGYGTRAFFFAKAGYGDGPAAQTFNDSAWRQLDLPHDWAVELPFDARGNTNHGSKAIGAGFPENSVGWYRKSIDIPKSDEGRRISLVLDGVYRDSVVWVNGHYIGTEPSGYTSFQYDITDYLNFGGTNNISVRVNASREEGWFYEGAGIYRHVWLSKTAALHVAPWGTFVSADVNDGRAEVKAQVNVANSNRTGKDFVIEQKIFAPDGRLVATKLSPISHVEGDETLELTTSLTVNMPQLWSIETPQLYNLVTNIRVGDVLTDTYETSFGIRTIAWDKDKGFFLNGQHVELHGVNIHQDFAGVGVAVPDALQDFRLKQLKKIGVNALRMSHNPPNPEVLTAADRLGLVVIDEHRMMGTTPEIRNQLEAMIRRDRNHPSVVLWSVGNEEWALEWSPLGTHLADQMQWIVKKLDPTRRTTVATSGSSQGVSLAADVIGFNYHTQHNIDAFHADHPDMPAVMTEEGSTTTTRGVYIDDKASVHLSAYDRQARPGNSASIEEAWRFTKARPFLSGMFVWTGLDYRGETTPFGFPAISSQFGMLDTTGIIKDSGYYLKSVWTSVPMVHLLPHWNWAGREEQSIDVVAYANADAVELYLNGHSLGRKEMTPDSHVSWSVPFAPGTLTAKAYRAGKLVAEDAVSTTGAPNSVHLISDRDDLSADGVDATAILVSLTDSQGRVVPTADNEVTFESSGPIRIIGVGNGDPGSHEADKPVDRYRFFKLQNWQSKALEAAATASETGTAVDMSSWRNPFQWLPPEQQPPVTPHMVVRGQFDRPEITNNEKLQLIVSRLGANQSVFLNGRPYDVPDKDGVMIIDIAREDILPQNSLAIVFDTPEGGIAKMTDKALEGVNWANIRISEPANVWKRRVFNGFAQVLVQSTGGQGQGVVKARVNGLKGSEISIKIK